MFVIRHAGSLKHYVDWKSLKPGTGEWTHDITLARVFDLKTEADAWVQEMKSVGYTVETILTFGAQIDLTEN